jgi:hypothetical protein
MRRTEASASGAASREGTMRGVSAPRVEIEDRRSRRPHRGRRALIVVPIVIFGLLFAAEVVDGAVGCGSVDPTDPANYSEVTILNDTAVTVTVDDCVGGYCQADLPARLAPGQRLADHAACAASGADMTSWRVTSGNGRVLGYIAVDTPRKHDGLVFPVSHARASRERPASSA